MTNQINKGDTITYHRRYGFGKSAQETAKVVAILPASKGYRIAILDNGDRVSIQA